jgi:hypothetical protein
MFTRGCYLGTMLRLLVCMLLAWAPAALAARLELPLRVPLDTVRDALKAQLGQVYRDGTCRHLNVDLATLDEVDGKLRLTGPGAGAFGVPIAGKCLQAVGWRGTMEFLLTPRIDASGRLRVEIVDSTLRDENGEKSSPAAFTWDLTKRYVHPRLERWSYDLGASREAITGLFRGSAPSAQVAAMEEVLRRLEIGTPRVEAGQVSVPLALELPDSWLATPPASVSAAPLTEAEVEALELALQPWDAFLVYCIRQLAQDDEGRELRQRLFTLLLDSRYRMLDLLTGETRSDAAFQALFVETWQELRSALADARYTLFLDAGDALAALQTAAPGLHMQLSGDGLRRLARVLRPGESADPLAYDWRVDPQLRELFSVEEVRDLTQPPPTKSLLDFFVRPAYAAEERALDRWVPAAHELSTYETRVAQLLQGTATTELRQAALRAPYDSTYRALVPTTALIESCWRQYVTRGGKVTYLRSQSSSVGIMQINQHVWRGFYDVEKLRWNAAYNMHAGAHILLRYVKDYAIPYAEKSGNPEAVPRAAYAVYNAGPRAVGRFAKPKPHPREQRVDDKLWKLYRGVAAGSAIDLKSCGVLEPAVKPAAS